jgi:hypothetical protein
MTKAPKISDPLINTLLKQKDVHKQRVKNLKFQVYKLNQHIRNVDKELARLFKIKKSKIQ